MISQALEYSLRAMVALACRHGDPMTVQRVSELAHIPAPYLSKLMQGLGRADLVQSRRGQGGGFILARPPEQISIWDVVQAIDPIKRIRGCPLGAQPPTLCPLHRRIDQAIASIEEAFRATTLAELLAECGDRSPLCGMQGGLAPLRNLSAPKARPDA